MNVSTK